MFTRTALAFALVLSFTVSAAAVSPEFMQRVLQRTWYGASVSDASFTRSGKVYLAQEHRITSVAGGRISGETLTRFTLDGASYSALSTFSGSYDARAHTVTFRHGRQIRADRLPNGLTWCGSSGTVTVYADRDHPGEYLLNGTVRSDCSGSTQLSLSSRRR